jgi:hypothetical protein
VYDALLGFVHRRLGVRASRSAGLVLPSSTCFPARVRVIVMVLLPGVEKLSSTSQRETAKLGASITSAAICPAIARTRSFRELPRASGDGCPQLAPVARVRRSADDGRMSSTSALRP